MRSLSRGWAAVTASIASASVPIGPSALTTSISRGSRPAGASSSSACCHTTSGPCPRFNGRRFSAHDAYRRAMTCWLAKRWNSRRCSRLASARQNGYGPGRRIGCVMACR